MRYQAFDAITLTRFNYGEADKIITYLTKENGLISVLAKGVRKPKAKLAGHIEPFGVCTIRVVKGKSLDTLIGAETLHRIDTTKIHPEALQVAFFCCEMAKRLLNQQQANESAYELLEQTLLSLQSGYEPRLVQQYFTLRFLVAIGSQPDIEKSHQHDRYYLVYDSGLVTVKKPNSHYGIITTATIKLWQILQNNTIEDVATVTGTSEALEQSQNLMQQYFKYHFDFEPKSPKVFQESNE